MSNNRVQLQPSEKQLLEVTSGDLIPMLTKNKKLIQVKQSAFDHYCKETGETYQVQIVVTRNENDFLEFLCTEELTNYESNKK